MRDRFYFAHSTKLLRGWDSTLHLGGRAGPLAFRVRKAAFKHDVEVAAERCGVDDGRTSEEDADKHCLWRDSGEAVAALRMTDGGYEFIGSDRQSTFVWTPAPVTLLSSIWRVSLLLSPTEIILAGKLMLVIAVRQPEDWDSGGRVAPHRVLDGRRAPDRRRTSRLLS